MAKAGLDRRAKTLETENAVKRLSVRDGDPSTIVMGFTAHLTPGTANLVEDRPGDLLLALQRRHEPGTRRAGVANGERSDAIDQPASIDLTRESSGDLSNRLELDRNIARICGLGHRDCSGSSVRRNGNSAVLTPTWVVRC
ncbi:MAG TPA: hypothetical protein VIV58_22365 [Kofleriaceae bacterium]